MTKSRSPSRRSRFKSPFTRHFIILATLALGILFSLCLTFTAGLYFFSRSPDFTARVLFSETASATPHERILVAGVMHNRIANPPFGNLKSLDAVARQPSAFSCVNDPSNSNWQKSAHAQFMSAHERSIFNDCLAIVSSPVPPALGPSGRPLVYYHDKSITKPPSWTNSQWHAIREITTDHFIFYSIVPAKP